MHEPPRPNGIMSIMAISGVIARVRVDDLAAAVPTYETLAGAPAHYFEFGAARLAAVGPFLLFSASGADGDRLANVVATLVTDDLDAQLDTVSAAGGTLVAPPAQTPNGRRAIVRHPDGAVFEYVGR
jgi:predicted enzyme related to lactoylglutathione lyase